jgi:glycosyltransferase involved in cell wall biosynthesis
MAVYDGDNDTHFAIALDSLEPFIALVNEVVIVKDGYINKRLNQAIKSKKTKLKLLEVDIPFSVGLGEALNRGVPHCTGEFILRMDADDISRPSRLKFLLDCLVKQDFSLDVIGSFISEFDLDPSNYKFIRKVPLDHFQIVRLMKIRNGMNHVSCLIRKEILIKVGGYQGGRGFSEDWWLWVRMIMNGAKFSNVPKVLVDVRVGNGFISRRRGWSIFKQDLILFKKMREIGFINSFFFVFLILTRLIQRLAPGVVLEKLYSLVRKVQ